MRLPRRSPLYPELARALAGADRLHVLHSDLEPVPVRPTATTSQSGCYRMRHGDPVDLRISRRHGRIALSFLHELGHLVDHQLGYERSKGTFASSWHDAFAGWRAAANALPCRLPDGTGRSRRRYFGSAKELWARSYAQTVLSASGDPWLERHLAGLLELDDMFVWQQDEFAPVSSALRDVLARLGLLRGAPVAAAA